MCVESRPRPSATWTDEGEDEALYELTIANKNYSSWSLRPWILMQQLDVEFSERLLPFGSEEWIRHRKVFPTVPLLRDLDTVVWDSLAITEYLAERLEGVWPEDPDARAWARCATAEMHSSFGALRSNCPMNCGLTVRLHETSAALARDLERLDELWRDGFDRFGGRFLAGERFSAVDAFFAPVAFRVRGFGLELSEPSMAYVQRVLALPAMQNWDAAAAAEDFREREHEAEVVALGSVIEDRRVPAGTIHG